MINHKNYCPPRVWVISCLTVMRNEYVVAILHAALHIVMDDTKKRLHMRPQYQINNEKSRGRVDYAIKIFEVFVNLAFHIVLIVNFVYRMLRNSFVLLKTNSTAFQ